MDERAVRYVDDITIGLDELEPEDGIVAAYEKALAHFELDVNFEKTKVLGHKAATDDQWLHEITRIRVGAASRNQRAQIDSFFSLAMKLADKSEKDAVLKWAIKRSRSFKISDNNYPYFVETLLGVARRAPACLRALVQLLVDARHNGRPLPIESIKKFATDHIKNHANVDHAFEVSWALFLCKGLAIKLNRADVKRVFSMRSSVCALILMDLDKRALIDGGIDDSLWKGMCGSQAGLESDMWLLSYEAVKKNWWSGPQVNYVTAHAFFGPMYKRGVYFYDEKKNVPTTKREARRSALRFAIERMIFQRWEEYF